MKHILTTDQFLTESSNQMYVLYYPSNIDIKGRNFLPSRWDNQGRMVATYPMIQDAVAHMDDEGLSHLYQVVVSARILTENEVYEELTENGFDAEDIMDDIENEGRFPRNPEHLSDILWYYHGFEIGDKVWVQDLSSIAKSMNAVQPTEIERVRKTIGL